MNNLYFKTLFRLQMYLSLFKITSQSKVAFNTLQPNQVSVQFLPNPTASIFIFKRSEKVRCILKNTKWILN